jgi:hypothetical protein
MRTAMSIDDRPKKAWRHGKTAAKEPAFQSEELMSFDKMPVLYFLR